MLGYRFFDYKYNIQGFTSDLFSAPHIAYIILAVIFTITFGVLMRKTKHERIEIYLKILSIFMAVWEVFKISWESYFDITTGQGFNYFGLLPLYTCSLFIYTLFPAAWGRGKVKSYSLAFITTISMVSGLIGMIYCNGLNYYPFWTFGAFYSLLFHFMMFFTGFFLLVTGYYKLDWLDIVRGWVPMVVLAIVVIPVNYVIQSDYMQIYGGGGVPLMEDLATKLAEVGLRPIFTAIMLPTYMILSSLVVAISKLVEKIVKK